jgi:hypothetical protein
VKLPQVHETEVYTNEDGHLVIKQGNFPEEDVYIILPKTYAIALATKINQLATSGQLNDFVLSDGGAGGL